MSKIRITFVCVASLASVFILGVLTAGRVLKTSQWSNNSNAYSSVGTQQVEPMRNIRFTVYDVGIYPEKMEVDAGRLSIVFDDRTGKHSGFVVERIVGNAAERVGQITASRDHWRTRAQVRVEPGRYRVFVTDRPEIRSTLTVNP